MATLASSRPKLGMALSPTRSKVGKLRTTESLLPMLMVPSPAALSSKSEILDLNPV